MFRLVNLCHYDLIDFAKEEYFICICSTAGKRERKKERRN